MKIRSLPALIAVGLSVFLGSCSSPVSQIAKDSVDNRAIIIKLPRPDLIVTDVKVTDFGSTFISYSYKVSNIGTAAANKSSVAVQAVVSPDLVFFDAGDQPAGGQILGYSGSINPGETVAQSFTCSLPAGTVHPETGTQYLLVKADYSNAVVESNEGNNVGNVQIQPKLPDLTITNATVARVDDYVVHYEFTVVNNGTATADLSQGIFQAYYANGTPGNHVAGAGGFQLVSNNQGLTSLAPGQSATYATDVGTNHWYKWYDPNIDQYLEMNVDANNGIVESNETNNQVVLLIHHPVQPDLVITNASASRVDDYVLHYEFTVVNNGTGPADLSQGIFQAYYVNTPGVHAAGAGGFQLVSNNQGLTSLAPGQSVTYTTDVGNNHWYKWYDPTIDQYLEMNVDANNGIVESNETNNQVLLLIHHPQQPDLVISNVSVQQSENFLTYTFTITNQGTGPADTSSSVVQAYLANGTPLDQSTPIGGFVLGPFGTTSIAPGQSVNTGFQSAMDPNWLNTNIAQYLLLSVDNNNFVPESNETNNLTSTLLHNAGESTF